MAGSAIGPIALTLSSANAFSNRTRHPSVCGPKPTPPLQPSDAPSLATTLVVKYTRRCPEGPWSCCVTIVAFKFSALPFQRNPRTFSNSLITNSSSCGTRCNDLAFWTPLSVKMMCSSVVWRLGTMAPYVIQIACRHGRVLAHHSLSKWQHLARVCFPKKTRKCSSSVVVHLEPRHAPRCVANQPRYQDAVARQFSRRRLSSESHIARQTPLITRFAFSILP